MNLKSFSAHLQRLREREQSKRDAALSQVLNLARAHCQHPTLATLEALKKAVSEAEEAQS